jgi:hypothetical protein
LSPQGSYHKVSRKYLPLYVAEFQFRAITIAAIPIFSDARLQGAEII